MSDIIEKNISSRNAEFNNMYIFAFLPLYTAKKVLLKAISFA